MIRQPYLYRRINGKWRRVKRDSLTSFFDPAVAEAIRKAAQRLQCSVSLLVQEDLRVLHRRQIKPENGKPKRKRK